VTALRIGATDRIFIAGMNGSGKSTLATAIANRWDRFLVYDPKVDAAAVPPNSVIAYGVEAAARALPGRVVYRPLPAEFSSISRHIGFLAVRVRSYGSHGVVFHELGDLGGSDRELDPEVAWLYRAGRSRGVPMISVTQRPVNVPIVAKSEARHVICFCLVDDDDRRAMARLMGPVVLSEPLPLDFSFWYRGPDLTITRRLAPLGARRAVGAGRS
jgi:hypothetical protein